MISQTAFTGFTEPIRCTPTTNSKSLISILANDLSRSTPALAIRMSMRPQASIACLTISATPASSVTDEPLAIASPPNALISATTLAAASDEPPEPSTAPPRSLTTTLQPRRASSSACWRPRPPPAPVTIATFPSKRMSAIALSPHKKAAALCAGAGQPSRRGLAALASADAPFRRSPRSCRLDQRPTGLMEDVMPDDLAVRTPNYDTTIPSLKGKVSPEEWATRVDLAACYRLVDLYG